jgi:hypothetical protein
MASSTVIVTPRRDLRHGRSVRTPRLRAEKVALPVRSFLDHWTSSALVLTSGLKVATSWAALRYAAMEPGVPIRVKTYVRCRTPFVYSRPSEFAALLDSVRSAPLDIAMVDRGTVSCSVDVRTWTALTRDEQKFLPLLPRGWNSDAVLTFEGALPRVGYDFDDNENLFGDKKAALSGVEVHEAAEETLAAVRRLFIAMNIAAPGAAQLANAAVIADGEVRARSGPEYPDMFELARQRADSNGWPKIEVLPLRDVWSWVQHFEGFMDGFGGGPVGRALNALTHIVTAPDAGVAMFWSMVGVESLFTHGDTGLLNQMRERSQLVLRTSATADHLIKNMYKARSKFVHGKLDFAALWFRFDATPAFQRSRRETRDACDVSIAMLIATLQEMIRRSWYGIRFGATVEGLPAS